MFCNFTPGIGPFSGKNQPDFTKKSTLTGLNTTFFHNKLFLSSLTIIVQSFRGCGTMLEVIWLKKFKKLHFFRKFRPGSVFLGGIRQKCIKSKKFFCKWFLSLFGTEKTPGEQDLKISTKKVYLPPTPIFGHLCLGMSLKKIFFLPMSIFLWFEVFAFRKSYSYFLNFSSTISRGGLKMSLF